MKKISIILLAVMTLTFLASCAAGVDFVEIDPVKVTEINFVLAPHAEVDTEAFIEAYNKAVVDDKAEDDDKSKDVIVISYSNGSVFTLYYLEDDEFAVTGSAVEKSYIIEAPELAEAYNNVIDPQAEFVKINEDDVTDAFLSAYPDAKIDKDAFIKAYNDAKLVGKAGELKGGNDVIVFTTSESTAFSVFYLGDDKFAVSGSKVSVPYIITSEDLADLYEAAAE